MRAGHIRDDIHGDIPLSSLEARVIDDPLFQRLRGVRQSAGAHLVFPTMRVTRFEHSVGVMHTASLFLRSALANTGVDSRKQLLSQITELVNGLEPFDRERAVEGGDTPKPDALYDTIHDFDVNHGLIASFDIPARTPASAEQHRSWVVALAVCEEGLRLCALLHDLGHLPYSHDFELAVDSALERSTEGGGPVSRRLDPLRRSEYHLHESISLGLSSVLRHRIAREIGIHPGGQRLFADAAFAMARRLLVAKAEGEAEELAGEQPDGSAGLRDDARVAKWLYSLIDSEIDADRADYILRDSAGYTLGTSVYDLSRLLDALAVGDVEGQPTTVVRRSGASAVEGYFLARFRLYSEAIYHHRIQKATASLRFAIEFALNQVSPELDEFFSAVVLLAGLGANGAAKPLSQRNEKEEAAILAAASVFERFDDARMGYAIEGLIVQPESWEGQAWRCFSRRDQGLITLWKRSTEIPVEPGQLRHWRQVVVPGKVSKALRGDLQGQGILLGDAGAKTWSRSEDGDKSALLIALPDGAEGEFRLEALSDHAPLFAALADVAREQVQVFAFQFEGVDDMPAADVAGRLLSEAESGDIGGS